MASILSRQKRTIYTRKLKGFWLEFSRNKIGLFGLAILVVFIFTAAFAQYLTPYDPLSQTPVAGKFAVPEWFRIFPAYQNLPPNIYEEFQLAIAPGPYNDIITFENNTATYNVTATQKTQAYITGYMNLSYLYDPPNNFEIVFRRTTQLNNARFSLELLIQRSNGTIYSIWDSYYRTDPKYETYPPLSSKNVTTLTTISSESGGEIAYRIGIKPWINIGSYIFEKGTYQLIFNMTFEPIQTGKQSWATMRIQEGHFKILGSIHGILGTEYGGTDLWTQLVYGARISLEIGLIAAAISISIGLLVGIVAGYLGGMVDEALMRVVDVMMCIPVLPILLALVQILSIRSIWYIIVLIAIFGWLGESRIVRSRVLSLREMPFVESAIASGGSKTYIMLRHILPNVIPVILAALVLSVPGAILTEASLSFLGFGDPSVPSWGRMLQRAWDYGAFSQMIWWWFLPPGIAIIIICVAFVFMGHAVDQVVNPRLRLRR
jgi:peptide/nickel transport system permease protein